MADSWKTNGDCKECRRKNYCRKVCTANKRWLNNLVSAKMAEDPVLGLVSNEIDKRYS